MIGMEDGVFVWAECRFRNHGGKEGYEVKGRKTGQSIFLPAAGRKNGDEHEHAATDGYYWTSTLSGGNSRNAMNLIFYKDYKGRDYSSRNYGFSVRPVTD